MRIDRDDLIVGRVYSNSKSGDRYEARKIIGVGPQFAASFKQDDLDCIRYRVVSCKRLGHENNMTKARMARWAVIREEDIEAIEAVETEELLNAFDVGVRLYKDSAKVVAQEGNIYLDSKEYLEDIDSNVFAISGDVIKPAGSQLNNFRFSPTLWDWINRVAPLFAGKDATIIIKEASKKELEVNSKPEMIYASGKYVLKSGLGF